MFKKTTLPNGLRIITVPMEGTKAVTVLVLVGTGSKYETKDINGISHFVEHMFGKGTKKRPTQLKVFEDIDRVGGQFDFSTSKEYTAFWTKVHFKFFDLALDWLSDVILNSKFEKKEIEKEKRVIVEEIKHYLDNPAVYIWDIWEKLLYGDQPAGWLILGKRDNILKFKRKDFLEYLKNHYSSKNIVVCVAGKIEPEAVETKIKKYFRQLNQVEPKQKLRVVEKQKRPQVSISFKKSDQTHLCLGTRAFHLSHPLRYAQSLLATILGRCPSSRLINSIRTKAGLAYQVYTVSEAYTDTGYLASYAGVAHKNVKKTISLILKEYKIIKNTKVKKAELQKAKDYVKGRLSLSLETSDAQALFYGMQELLENRILTIKQIFKKIDDVTPDDIQKVARDIFRPERLNLALIGPFKDKKKFEKLLLL